MVMMQQQYFDDGIDTDTSRDAGNGPIIPVTMLTPAMIYKSNTSSNTMMLTRTLIWQ